MKKKLLLGLIPVLMALSACNGVGPNEETFLEDTTAHTELFGEAEEFTPVRKNAAPLTTPELGYQISYDEANSKIAIRFVAKVDNPVSVTSALWKRGVAAADGSTPQNKKFSDDARPATKYYHQLTGDNGVIIDGNVKAGDFCFVDQIIHTFRGI